MGSRFTAIDAASIPTIARLRPYIYSLALGVYCTSWTFFGAVGSAVRDGWGYLPIYLGPALVFLFGLPFMERLVEIGRAHKVSSIADFIASRFGKSRALAVLVTLIALSAAIPYIALQYKAVAASIAALTPVAAPHVPWYRDTALAVALMMALFAVLFGARRVDATGHREGLMLAIAFESLFKLLAFVAVGVFACLHLRGQPWLLPPRLASGATLFNADAASSTLLAAAAIFCLPRQFQVGVVECAHTADLKHARWLLPAYLGVFSAVVVPVVALATISGLSTRTASDSLILTLPMSYGPPWLTVLVFLGGLSAATAMVVVASTALATMISNDIAAPLLWRQRLEAGVELGAPRAVGAARGDRDARAARVRLLSLDLGIDQPGRDRDAGVRRRRAVRSGDFRRAVLERGQPRGRVLGHAGRVHRLGISCCSCPTWSRGAYSHRRRSRRRACSVRCCRTRWRTMRRSVRSARARCWLSR